MPCLAILDNAGAVVGHLCRPGGTVRQIGKRRRRFWCFKCRKRLLHQRMAIIPERGSYYEPNFWWECPQCHEENVLFPGWSWTE
jgi:hypothetical protein